MSLPSSPPLSLPSTPLPSRFPGPTPSSVLSISAASVRTTATRMLDENLWPEPLFYGSRTIKAIKHTWPWLIRGLITTGLLYLLLRLYRRHQRLRRQMTVEKSYSLFGNCVRFGLDIGGTLCKVVYFEPEETLTPTQSALKLRVSTFIRRSHSYGVTGRRDQALEVTLPQIKGTLHFLKFQTSMMPNFVTIVKENELSPQRPLKEGGGTDEEEEEEERRKKNNNFMNRRNNINGLYLAHHLHQIHQNSIGTLTSSSSSSSSSSLITSVPNPQMIRSYSAAWRSEEEYRRSYLSALHELPQSSATPVVDAITSDFPSSSSSNVTQMLLEPLNDAPLLTTQQQQPDFNSPNSAALSTATTMSLTSNPSASATASSTTDSHASSLISPSSSTSSVAHIHPRSVVLPLSQTHDHQQHQLLPSPTSSSGSPHSPDPSITSPIHPFNDSTYLFNGSNSSSAMFSEQQQQDAVAPPRASTPVANGYESASCPSSPLVNSSAIQHLQQTNKSNNNNTTSSPNNPRKSISPPAPNGSSTNAPTSSPVPVYRHLFQAAPKRVIHPSPPTPIPPSVCATGGGAFKFEKLFRDELHITLHKEDELRALVKGIDFMIHTCADECYYLSHYRFREPLQRSTYESKQISYPYLVVNIGSGVSILKVAGPRSFERVGGTSLGGGTFYGLCRALTGCTSFEEALSLAERGRFGMADLLVGDIYGGDYDEKLGLAADTVASSFGKLIRGDALREARKEDLAKAALVMITNNIGSLANLYARKVLNVPQMIFVGNFLNGNDMAKRGLAFATEYWSKGTAKALFLTHEGYFGAVGSLLGE